MDNKVFLHKINDVKAHIDDKSLSSKLQVFFGKRAINKMIHKAAKAQADAMYKQTCKFYNDIVENNLN